MIVLVKVLRAVFQLLAARGEECHCVAIQSCFHVTNNCTIIAVKNSCVCEVNLSFLFVFLLLYSQSVRLALTLIRAVLQKGILSEKVKCDSYIL
jgi:hypothetical protein